MMPGRMFGPGDYFGEDKILPAFMVTDEMSSMFVVAGALCRHGEKFSKRVSLGFRPIIFSSYKMDLLPSAVG